MSPAPTSTGSADAAVTVTVAVPEIPLALAEIVALPEATAVTSPLFDTVATELFDVPHVYVGVTLPGEGVAVSCTV
jgi:hypothetical protein